jgi:toxin ParE1/3/4
MKPTTVISNIKKAKLPPDQIEAAVKDIGLNPERWPVIRFTVRRRLIHRFPFGLLYRIDPDEVIVLAVMHLHRHPDYWLNRLQIL